eukprot:g9203.t1
MITTTSVFVPGNVSKFGLYKPTKFDKKASFGGRRSPVLPRRSRRVLSTHLTASKSGCLKSTCHSAPVGGLHPVRKPKSSLICPATTGEDLSPPRKVQVSPPPPPPPPPEVSEDYKSYFINVGTFFVVSFLGFGYLLYNLPDVVPTAESVTGGWRLGLILAHSLSFFIAPLGMGVFFKTLPELKVRPRSVFASQLGFMVLMAAYASEVGWHVTQDWYCLDDYSVLNFMFYFFLTAALALWSDGFVEKDTWKTRLVNLVYAVGLFASCVYYSMGADQGHIAYKYPMYFTLAFGASVLTYRGYRILEDWRIVFYPVLSIGACLFTMYILVEYGQEVTPNALLHIIHKVIGVDAGIAYLIYLFYDNNARKKLKS